MLGDGREDCCSIRLGRGLWARERGRDGGREQERGGWFVSLRRGVSECMRGKVWGGASTVQHAQTRP